MSAICVFSIKSRRWGRWTVASYGHQGQFIIEYALTIALMAAALFTMQMLLRAYISGAWRDAVDLYGHGHQYEKGVTEHDGDYSSSSQVTFDSIQ